MRRCVVSRIAVVLCAAGVAGGVGGCTSSLQTFTDATENGWFSKPVSIFSKPTWASSTIDDRNVQLNPRGSVAPEDLVGADGRCTAPIAEAAPAAAAAPVPPPERSPDGPVGSVAGDLATAPMPAATPASVNPNGGLPDQPPGGPTVMGGVALGMSECDVVRRAGQPSNVNIGAGDRGERKVVLTYLAGTWPGIYTFNSGRLKIVDRAPEPPPSAKPPVKKQKAKKPTKPKTANSEVVRPYVQ